MRNPDPCRVAEAAHHSELLRKRPGGAGLRAPSRGHCHSDRGRRRGWRSAGHQRRTAKRIVCGGFGHGDGQHHRHHDHGRRVPPQHTRPQPFWSPRTAPRWWGQVDRGDAGRDRPGRGRLHSRPCNRRALARSTCGYRQRGASLGDESVATRQPVPGRLERVRDLAGSISKDVIAGRSSQSDGEIRSAVGWHELTSGCSRQAAAPSTLDAWRSGAARRGRT